MDRQSAPIALYTVHLLVFGTVSMKMYLHSIRVKMFRAMLLCCCAMWDEIMIGLLITHLHILNDFDILYRYRISLIIITDLSAMKCIVSISGAPYTSYIIHHMI